ncbi:hypothetical protein ACTWQF_34195 [Streptomyces sp. 8N114]|uniref:hypothetical protein n=1 Tax=Streptomyces sp. 8N114 TaxID=3457419 RepID=UPI003FD00DD8
MSEDVRWLAPAREHLVCAACPSLCLPLGTFDVAAKPSAESAYAREQGYRIDRHSHTPVCVHPHKVGLPPAGYASRGVPLPGAAQPAAPPKLPEERGGLDGWLLDYLREANEEPEVFELALERAGRAARERFGDEETVAALRRVLGSGLL